MAAWQSLGSGGGRAGPEGRTLLARSPTTSSAICRTRRRAASKRALSALAQVDRDPHDCALGEEVDLDPPGNLPAIVGTCELVGGAAVVHHGYVRATDDLDVLVEADAPARLQPHLASYGFVEEGTGRLRHVATAVAVDLLVSGAKMPRAGAGSYPSVGAVGTSARDSAFADLAGLVQLKLRAGRHQDLADVVAPLKALDEVAFTELEVSIAAELRPALADLRRDALEELSWDR